MFIITLVSKMLKRKKAVMELIPQRRCESETYKFEKERKKIDETH